MQQTEKQKDAQNRNNYIRTLRAVWWANRRSPERSNQFAEQIEWELRRIKAKTMEQQLKEMEGYIYA